MVVEIWSRDSIIFEGDLPAENRCGNSYVLWQGEWLCVQNEGKVWLTGYAPSKQYNTVEENLPIPNIDTSDIPLSKPSEIDPLFESARGGGAEQQDDSTGGTTMVKIDKCMDQEQYDAIHTPKNERMLVGAGPGTGKTAVACERIAFLIEQQNCNPGDIFLVSFTRTAVAEIRERIAGCLNDKHLSSALNILTLDSFAWSINSGFNENATLKGNYDSNIHTVTSILQKHPLVHEYCQKVQHLLIDEAQDIIGKRALFVMEIIKSLHPSAGFTVFSDDAQAIYGFNAKNDSTILSEYLAITLPEWLRNEKKITCEMMLKTIHRTSARSLKTIFSDVRDLVLKQDAHPLSKFIEVCEQIKKNAHSNEDTTFDPLHFSEEDNSFAIFRWKREVLRATDALEGRPHRIRMGGITSGTVPWIGAILGGMASSKITRNEFLEYWQERNITFKDRDAAWNELTELVGKSQKIDLKLLRQNIAIQNLPRHLLMHTLGGSGPIIGTIHAAKGREAETVYLYFPERHISANAPDIDYDEETRVIFVGATRPKRYLHTRRGFEYCQSYEEKRIKRISEMMPNYRYKKVMLGLRNDIDPACLVGKGSFGSPNDAHMAQMTLLKLAEDINEHGSPISLLATFNGSRYELKTRDGITLCTLSDNVRDDLLKIVKKVPAKINRLWLMDICTLALTEDDISIRNLHKPWCDSGIMLYPRIIGYPEIRVKRSK
jgi:hypothetical protein